MLNPKNVKSFVCLVHTVHIPVSGYAAETEEGRRLLAAGLNMNVNNAKFTFYEKSSFIFFDIY